MQHFVKFDMPRSCVQSIYRRMGVTRQLGTTGRPPVPKGIYTECQLEYLRDIDHKIKAHAIPESLIINIDQTPVHMCLLESRLWDKHLCRLSD